MDRDALLKRLMAADFALHETVLFLDSHPKNKKAMEYYEVKSSDWNWTDCPWPWQN